jgi:ABC-type nitrate/sulfonate/bicarbonate transport system ATPase subunit
MARAPGRRTRPSPCAGSPSVSTPLADRS